MRDLYLGGFILSTLTLAACGTVDERVNYSDDFWKGREDEVIAQLKRLQQTRGYEYIAFINFVGEDFGHYAEKEDEVLLPLAFVLKKTQLSEKNGALVS